MSSTSKSKTKAHMSARDATKRVRAKLPLQAARLLKADAAANQCSVSVQAARIIRAHFEAQS